MNIIEFIKNRDPLFCPCGVRMLFNTVNKFKIYYFDCKNCDYRIEFNTSNIEQTNINYYKEEYIEVFQNKIIINSNKFYDTGNASIINKKLFKYNEDFNPVQILKEVKKLMLLK